MSKVAETTDRKQMIECNLLEAAEIIRDSPWDVPITLHGQPGGGKTACMETEAWKASARYDLHNLNEMEPPDLLGIPYAEAKHFKYKVPYFWYQASTEPEVEYKGPIWMVFDDVGTANEQNQNALASWVHARKNDLIQLRDNVRFLMASNRVIDNSGVTPMPKHFCNRGMHLYIKLDVDTWLEWARINGVHPWCVGWIRHHPNFLNTFDPDSSDEAFCTARSIHNLSKVLHKLGDRLKTGSVMMSKMAYGLIGPASFDFTAWVKFFDKTVAPEDIIKDPEHCRTPQENELDILHATVASLEHYVTTHPVCWQAALTYALRINPDLGLLLAKQVVDVVLAKMTNAEKTKAAGSKQMIEMFKRWGPLMAQ